MMAGSYVRSFRESPGHPAWHDVPAIRRNAREADPASHRKRIRDGGWYSDFQIQESVQVGFYDPPMKAFSGASRIPMRRDACFVRARPWARAGEQDGPTIFDPCDRSGFSSPPIYRRVESAMGCQEIPPRTSLYAWTRAEVA
jgi:hypothetical protein